MTTEQEALEIADAITCFEGCNCDKNQAAAMLRKLVAEREADRAAMREALEALELGRDALHELAARYHDEMRFHYPDVHASMDSDAVLADAAITDLRQRLEGTT